MDRPVIGIVGNLLIEQGGFSPGMERSYANNDYVAAVERAGGIPLILPVVRGQDVAERQTESVDGLLVTGGYDIDPLLYGEEPIVALEFVYLETDIFQLRTIKTALKRGQPILGICKGMQLLNVACGGTLHQDLSQIPGTFVKHSQDRRRSCPSHTVHTEGESLVAELFGSTFPVNSYHHQALKEIGRGLVVTSRAMDGVVESVEMKEDSFVVGVQWHPEMMLSGGDEMLPLLLRFVEAAGRFLSLCMSIWCDVVLSPGEALPEADCWLVIDILRATTTMCAFFDRGGGCLYPTGSIEEAFALRDCLAAEGCTPLLMGERNALPPPGFDLGNSPLELSAALLSTCPTAVMATTNGTRALLKAAATGAKIYPVCARNAGATLACALAEGERIGILCAGLNGRAGLDDAACAGLLVEQLVGLGATLEDGARMALAVWQAGMRNLPAMLNESVHGERLLSMGFGPDMAYAAEIDVSRSVLALQRAEELLCIARLKPC